MHKVKITAIRQTVYPDLMAKYENPIELTLADGPRGQFLDGSWHARSALMANADKVQELASKLPYMQFLK